MKRIFGLLLIIGLTVVSSTTAQDYEPLIDTTPTASYDGIPTVHIQTQAVNFQKSLLPVYYQTHSALRDLKWAERNDSAFVDFWETDGSYILFTLKELSGLEWLEGEIDLYLVRYYHSIGNGDPLVIPIGGIRKGSLTESSPTDIRMKLNVIYQLAERMLTQSERFGDEFRHPISRHPLMQPGPYRRDNLAMLLALVTCERIIGLDSTLSAYQSAFWKQNHPGREVFEKYMLTDWILSPDQPLTRWVLDEPRNSPLVALTRPPETTNRKNDTGPMKYIEDLPLKGQFGFSLKIDTDNKRIIHKIDPERVAFACGLREGDVIRSVDGARVRNQRDMIEKLFLTFKEGGSTVQIEREGAYLTILLQPVDLGYDDYQYELWNESDSLGTPIDSSGSPFGPDSYK